MRRWKKVLLTVAVLILVLLLVLAGAGTWLVRRPWPKTQGTIAVPGLTAPVEVIRDEWGVPHIYAQDEHDLFFAQGYVHAQDRLWQMEFNRRVAGGRLSAAVGGSTLETDRFLRTLGLRRSAERDWATADDETRAILEAYAAGVNAYIEAHPNRLPLEFTILGVTPEPWSPVDTLAWGQVMSYQLGNKYGIELLRARLVAALGPQATQELLPPYPDEGPVIIPEEAGGYAWLGHATGSVLDPLALLAPDGAGWGSNNWVVHGSRTATGLPLLANDMHLGLNMPSIWYENGLHGGRFEVVGYSFPGVPMVIVGHNRQIAWGVTNLGPDTMDLYIEKLDDPAHPTRYEFAGEWRDLEVVRETVEIKGSDPVALDVLLTHHGPILNGVLAGMEEAEPLALRWAALEGNRIFRSVSQLNLATNWDEFRQALSYWDAPSQNFIYADATGNIGYQSPGKIPVRAAGHQGLVPVPGWTGEYEWSGYIPFSELPNTFNPPTGFVATANNKVVPDEYPYLIASEWAAPYRAQRITDLLAADESITLADMQAIHAQVYSLPAAALRPYLLAVQPANALETRALAQVQEWDLANEADRPGAAVYQVWFWRLLYNTLGDELGEDLMASYAGQYNMHIPVLVDMMAGGDSAWFDDVATPQVETEADIAQRSFSEAVAWLQAQLGDDPQRWEWGRLHTISFVHQPLGQSGIGLLESLFNSKAIPARGDNTTVNAAVYNFGQPFAMQHGVSQRYIADLSDLGNSLTVHTTGQSGHVLHRHREDMIHPWQQVQYHPMLFARDAVEAHAEATLTLTPP
jgi:penicillin G amidase